MVRRSRSGRRALLALLVMSAGCGGGGAGSADGGLDPANPHGLHLTDVTVAALGARIPGGRSANDPDGFNHGFGAGAALGDLDGDGDLDLVLARDDDPASDSRGGPTVIFWNQSTPGQIRFREDDVLAPVFTGVKAHGVALGDYDGDGDLDVFVAAEGRDYLLRNDGGGHFAEVAVAAGVAGRDDDLGMGALWADLNHDGLLDLYVMNMRSQLGRSQSANRLYVNAGDGSFVDVSAASGAASYGATWTAAASDLDGDGRLDLYVANDQFIVQGVPDALLHLDHFEGDHPVYLDRAAAVGVADYRTTMGIAIRDVDGDGQDDLYLTNWGPKALFSRGPDGLWSHAEDRLGLAASAVPGFGGDFLYVTWGARFFDLDRDGALEVMLVNGAIAQPLDEPARRQQDLFLRQPAIGAPFVDLTAAVGLPTKPGGEAPLTGRGLVVGDLDGDGVDDLIVTPFDETYRVYHGEASAGRHAVRVRLRGTVSSPLPAGAVLAVVRDDGSRARVRLYAGGDVHSWSDDTLMVGLGAGAATRVDVEWPSGLVQRIDGRPDFALDRTVTVTEPAWLTLSARVVSAGDPAPLLIYAPVDAAGQPLGAAAIGRTVVVTRSDGQPAPVSDRGDGSYAASIGHPGAPGLAALTISVDGTSLLPRPIVRFR